MGQENIDSSNEVWLPVVGYDGRYEVSNLGRVRSLMVRGYARQNPRILKPQRFPSGYSYVNLGGSHTKKITRIVAEAFIPNPHNLPMVNHRDEDKSNNRVENLEWCDLKYNVNYGTRNARLSVKMINRTDMSRQVKQFTASGEYIRTWPSISEAGRQTGINRKSLTNCCKFHPKNKTAGGFVWRYA